MDTVNGLPAHPLFVHAPVVLMPLATLVAVVLVFRPELRRRWGIGTLVGAVVVLVSTQMAVSSGESFAELAGDAIDVTKHRSLGTTARNLVAVFTVVTGVSVAVDRRPGVPTWVPKVAAGLTALAAVAATVWMARAGDEGARLVWDGVVGSIAARR